MNKALQVCQAIVDQAEVSPEKVENMFGKYIVRAAKEAVKENPKK